MIVHLNGELLQADAARLDVTDRGFTLGDGLYETIRAAAGAPLRLSAHLERLRHGAEVLDLGVPLSDEDLEKALLATLQVNGLSDGVLRLTLSRGPGQRGLPPPGAPRPTLLITAHATKSLAESPLRCVIATTTRRNEHSPLSRCKCTNCLDAILARQEAARRGADEAILLNTVGKVAETTVANLFAVIGEAVLTPPLSDGALPGVMRAEVIARLGGEERSLKPAELTAASEVFATNSLGLRPVVLIDGQPVGDGQPGPVLQSLK